MGRYVAIGGMLLNATQEFSKDPDTWMAQSILAEAAHYTPFVGITRRLLGSSFLWMKAPPAVEDMSGAEKGRLLERTLRRLVRHGHLRAERIQEHVERRTDRGKRHVLTWHNRYFRVNILEALALAAAEPHELQKPRGRPLP